MVSAGSARPALAMSRHIEDLEAEARYHRQRYDLYRARAYGMRATSPERLRELERASAAADARLAHAKLPPSEPASG